MWDRVEMSLSGGFVSSRSFCLGDPVRFGVSRLRWGSVDPQVCFSSGSFAIHCAVIMVFSVDLSD